MCSMCKGCTVQCVVEAGGLVSVGGALRVVQCVGGVAGSRGVECVASVGGVESV